MDIHYYTYYTSLKLLEKVSRKINILFAGDVTSKIRTQWRRSVFRIGGMDERGPKAEAGSGVLGAGAASPPPASPGRC